MKVQYREEMANYSDPESCELHREVQVEALTGETDRPAMEPRNQRIWDADVVIQCGRPAGKAEIRALFGNQLDPTRKYECHHLQLI
jgi:hypothetical protein